MVSIFHDARGNLGDSKYKIEILLPFVYHLRIFYDFLIARCIDCAFVRGMGCCKFGNGTERCEFPENCPTFDKENGTESK